MGNASNILARIIPSGMLSPLFVERFVGRDGELAVLEELYDSASGSPLQRMQYVDVRSYLAYDLLPKVDDATMAHGLEARAPLLDHEIVEFALSLPSETGLKRGSRSPPGRRREPSARG